MRKEVEFSDKLLSAYIHGFFGYGNYDGSYWFVGMEEGGGSNEDEVKRRVRIWAQGGQQELEDLAEYHEAVGVTKYFKQPTVTQRTWNKLIRVVLAAQGLSPSLDDVKDYQREHFGRRDGETCLPELLPLPSHSVRNWIYAHFSTVEGLQSRDSYRNHYAELRALHLKHKIAEYCPRTVVFYSVDAWYRPWWETIAASDFERFEIGGEPYHTASSQGTKFFIVKHPVSKGITVDYFHHIGNLIGQG